MAQIKDTNINGNLSVTGNFNIGINGSINIDIDTEFLNIIESIDGMESIIIDSDEEA